MITKVFMLTGSAFTIIVITNGNRCSTTVAAVFHFMTYLKTFKIGKVNEVFYNKKQFWSFLKKYKLNFMSWLRHFIHFIGMFIGQLSAIFLTNHVVFNEINFIKAVKYTLHTRNLFPKEIYNLFRNCFIFNCKFLQSNIICGESVKLKNFTRMRNS